MSALFPETRSPRARPAICWVAGMQRLFKISFAALDESCLVADLAPFLIDGLMP